jgi:3-oxoadipate enol-lactonase
MPSFVLSDGCNLHYEWDDFTAPWGSSETVLFIHGNSEDSRAWFGWIPYFARDYKMLRPDWRGYGRSTPMPLDYAWSLDTLADDFDQLLASLNITRCHVVGAKIGGAIAMHFAARKPRYVQSLTVIGSPVSGQHLAGQNLGGEEIETQGPEVFYRRTMGARLGSDTPKAAIEYWIAYMSAAPRTTLLGFNRALPKIDVRPGLPYIVCPTLVITGDSGGIIDSVDSVKEWQKTIPKSELLVIRSDSYHIAVTQADRVAPAALAFIKRNAAPA